MRKRYEEFEIEVDTRRAHVFVEIRPATAAEVEPIVAKAPAWKGTEFAYLKFICSRCGTGIAGVYPRGAFLSTTCSCYRMFEAHAGGKSA